MFVHNLLDLPVLIRHDGETRYYETPDGNKYPSVTTVLGAMQDKTHLHVWRKRIGEEEAAKITRRASDRGTAVHKLCENLVLNTLTPELVREALPISAELFGQIKPVLTKHVTNVRSSEGSLFSHKIRLAGSVDLVAEWDGELAVIDFKTSSRIKREEWIENYFFQCALYAYMLWEMTGEIAKTMVVIIAVEEDSFAQVFEKNVSDYLPKAIATVKSYHAKYGEVT